MSPVAVAGGYQDIVLFIIQKTTEQRQASSVQQVILLKCRDIVIENKYDLVNCIVKIFISNYNYCHAGQRSYLFTIPPLKCSVGKGVVRWIELLVRDYMMYGFHPIQPIN